MNRNLYQSLTLCLNLCTAIALNLSCGQADGSRQNEGASDNSGRDHFTSDKAQSDSCPQLEESSLAADSAKQPAACLVATTVQNDGSTQQDDSLGMEASGFVHAEGTKLIDEKGKPLFLSGVNLGNWLVWEGYLMMGDTKFRTHSQYFNSLSQVLGSSQRAADFEYQWRLNYVDEKAIADLKGLGFNSVRVPFLSRLFWKDKSLTDDGFLFLDKLIGYCRSQGVYVLLDMHGAPGYQNPGDHSDNGNSNSTQPRDSVKFWDNDNVDIASKIWQHIADHYKNEPVVWGYDLINEPVPQSGREFEMLPAFVKMRNAIRAVDGNHVIVAEGNWWASDLTKIDWNDAKVRSATGISSQWDKNLVYEIHHYGLAADTMGREKITNNLNIPLIIGEFGESDTANILAITNWAKQNLAGYFPWTFKKMTRDKALWTIPSNSAFDQVKASINAGGTPTTQLYDPMIDFAKNNIRNGHPSLIWSQSFYNAIEPN